MKTKDLILAMANEKVEITSLEVVKKLKISRQAAAIHLRDLVNQKKLEKLGNTKNARYLLIKANKNQKTAPYHSIVRTYTLNRLKEDIVFKELTLKLALRQVLSDNTFSIATYAFTEMLNNAIDHSSGRQATVSFAHDQTQFCFDISDDGIGIFENIRCKFDLSDNLEAIEHLLKGKQTTLPQKHSGQGIFFTSKIADKFVLESSNYRLTIDNKLSDVFLKDIRQKKGTKVSFFLSRQTKKNLRKLFDEYSNENLEFDKTTIFVHLTSLKSDYISRSQAKKMLFGLEKFQRIVLDFSKVNELGQGFADEVFRVFRQEHPEISLETKNASPSVLFMISRVKAV